MLVDKHWTSGADRKLIHKATHTNMFMIKPPYISSTSFFLFPNHPKEVTLNRTHMKPVLVEFMYPCTPKAIDLHVCEDGRIILQLLNSKNKIKRKKLEQNYNFKSSKKKKKKKTLRMNIMDSLMEMWIWIWSVGFCICWCWVLLGFEERK